MFDPKQLSAIADTHDPASLESIQAAQRKLDVVFPDEFVEFLLCSNGLESTETADCYDIALFPVEDLVDKADAYEVDEYRAGHIFIGFDGGGRMLLLKGGKRESPVFLIDAGTPDVSDARELAPSLSAWIANGFELREPPEIEHPDKVDIWLLKDPQGGILGLRRLCKQLRLEVPVSELRGILTSIPYRLCHDVSYLPYARYASEINETYPCLGVSEVEAQNPSLKF